MTSNKTVPLPRRLYIETYDIDEHQVSKAERCIRRIFDATRVQYNDPFFDEIIEEALHNGAEAWQAVLRCDEIYADSSLYGATGARVYAGAPVLFDTMLRKGYDDGIKGKSVYLLHPEEEILWGNVDPKLLRAVFATHNTLFVTDSDRKRFVKPDINQLIKKQMKQ